MQEKATIGLIGLAVMGQNLVLNLNDHGYSVAVYNRTTSKTTNFINGPAAGRERIYGTESIEKFIGALKKPKKVMLMVKAGEVVDKFINLLTPFLEAGDVVIDGGNSHFPDTIRRTDELREEGILFVGMGVSGGEEGARGGPSLMPGGNHEAWPIIRDIFTDIAAKTPEGDPCCDWIGSDGAGHFVKMVHNGIEYGDIQLICESYQLLKESVGLAPSEISEIFARWNKGDLESYLIEITADIFKKQDKDGTPLVENILDTAGQKGTGKWTVTSALELGTPVTLIGEAVFARFLSALKEDRVRASAILEAPGGTEAAEQADTGGKGARIEEIRKALFASKIVSYAQGFMLMKQAAERYGWKLDYGRIAQIWREGCIIRSIFLSKIREAFDRTPDLSNLLLDPYFTDAVHRCQDSWRTVVSDAVLSGSPVPTLSAGLAFFDGYRNSRLPANLLQAQRDYFGAHTYERVDKPRGTFFHADWTGEGDETNAKNYTA